MHMANREAALIRSEKPIFSKKEKEQVDRFKATGIMETISHFGATQTMNWSLGDKLFGRSERIKGIPATFYDRIARLQTQINGVQEAMRGISAEEQVLERDDKTGKKTLNLRKETLLGLAAELSHLEADPKTAVTGQKERILRRIKDFEGQLMVRDESGGTFSEVLRADVESLRRELSELLSIVEMFEYAEEHPEESQILRESLELARSDEKDPYAGAKEVFSCLRDSEYHPPEYLALREQVGARFVGVDEVKDQFGSSEGGEAFEFSPAERAEAFESLSQFVAQKDIADFLRELGSDKEKAADWILTLDHPAMTMRKMIESATSLGTSAPDFSGIQIYFEKQDGASMGEDFLDRPISEKIRWRIARVGVDEDTAWNVKNVGEQMQTAATNARPLKETKLRRRTIHEALKDFLTAKKFGLFPETYRRKDTRIKPHAYRELTADTYAGKGSYPFVMNTNDTHVTFNTGRKLKEDYPYINPDRRDLRVIPDAVGLTRA